jgi:transcriptional regulator with XRE-family HTH domain
MTSRIVFDAAFAHAVRIRGLTLTDLAHRAHVSVATASSAVRGRQVNIATALRLARVVGATPVVPELEAWARSPRSGPGGDDDPGGGDADG